MSNPLDITPLIDPEVAAALIPLDLRLGELSDATLAAIRTRLGAVPLPELSDRVARSDHAVAERPPVSVRVGYSSEDAPPLHRSPNSKRRLHERTLDARIR